MSAVIIYMVCAHREEAQIIARHLLEERLVACANIMPAHDSLYWWDRKIQNGSEVAVILKTQDSLFDQVKEAVLPLHSYDCPCIVAWPIAQGYDPFMKWIASETTR